MASRGGRIEQIAGPLVRGGILAILALALVYCVFVNAYVNVFHRTDPERALYMLPNDPMGLNTRGSFMLGDLGEKAAGSQELAKLARASLVMQALNPGALRLLGLSAAPGSFDAGRPAMTLSDKMTRRDMLVQFWLIEEAVYREDVAGALLHYDSALRTSEESQQVLFPILTDALRDTALWAPFKPFIREPAPWLEDFTRYAVRNTKQPTVIASMIEQAGGLPRNVVFVALEGELLKRLVEGSSFADTAHFYQTLPGSDPKVLSSATFSPNSIDERFTPISWELYNVAGATSTFLREDDGAPIELNIVVDTAFTGAISRKLLILAPGRYHLRTEQRLAAAAPGSNVTWEARCGNGNGPVLWSGETALAEQRRPVEGDILVPAGCPAVTLRLLANAGSGENGADITIGAIMLQSAR